MLVYSNKMQLLFTASSRSIVLWSMCWPDSSEIDASSFHDTALACVLLRVYLRATGRSGGILNLTYL